jgi:hypothetical protein
VNAADLQVGVPPPDARGEKMRSRVRNRTLATVSLDANRPLGDTACSISDANVSTGMSAYSWLMKSARSIVNASPENAHECEDGRSEREMPTLP